MAVCCVYIRAHEPMSVIDSDDASAWRESLQSCECRGNVYNCMFSSMLTDTYSVLRHAIVISSQQLHMFTHFYHMFKRTFRRFYRKISSFISFMYMYFLCTSQVPSLDGRPIPSAEIYSETEQ